MGNLYWISLVLIWQPALCFGYYSIYNYLNSPTSGVVVKTIHSNIFDKKTQINVSALSAGMYFIKVKMQGYTAETWIGFLTNDEKDTANSVYTGIHPI